jgi:ribonucleoside-diphosphate reductase alpha subunit
MQRVMDNGSWSLFSEDTAPGLSEVYGQEFEALYEKYENTPGLARNVIPAQTVYKAICASIVQTGIPYILFKDTCNRFSNHNHLGTIKCSNLCTEIIQYSSPDEIAVCNLASIALPKFVRPHSDEKFDHPELERVTRLIVRNENKIIDVEFYPLPQCELSNLKHRPMGIGIQGLADAFQMLMYPFDSDEAKVLNREIFETIYFAALDESCRLAEKLGKTYPSYKGSQVERGVLHFDHYPKTVLSDRHDWKGLRERIATFGIYNSLLVAPMPTASTSQILGNNEAIEPYTTNIYSRRTLAGDFVVINPHLVAKLTELGLWNENMKNTIIQHNGSVQNINSIPPKVKQVFRTAWEIRSSSLIAMAADRAPFIDQHQSLNLFVETPTINLIWNAHLMAWKHKVKGLYYMRSKPASQALKFTINKNQNTEQGNSQAACPYRPGQAPPDCASCGS